MAQSLTTIDAEDFKGLPESIQIVKKIIADVRGRGASASAIRHCHG